jgi:nicotinate-nucleotide adenylyltransferase
MKKLQEDVNKTFTKNFGYTPLTERLNDIKNEFQELMNWQSVSNLKEELGDLLASCLELATESEWDAEELVRETLRKIESKHLQYRSLGRKYKIAILGGAFNPITKGHIELARYVLDNSGEFDEVWLLPAYKHMYNKDMADPIHRIKMCELATENDRRIKVWDFEIKNELSGETYNLFKRLKSETEWSDKYQFSMIIGMDNALTFEKWVNFRELEKMTRFVVVPRKGIYLDSKINWFLKPPHIYLNSENEIPEISSTTIRELIKKRHIFVSHPSEMVENKNLDMEILKNLDKEVFSYIITNGLYQ